MTIQALIERAKYEEFVTVMELAALTRRSPQAVWRAIRAKRVPGVNHVGRSIRIHRATALGHFHRVLQ